MLTGLKKTLSTGLGLLLLLSTGAYAEDSKYRTTTLGKQTSEAVHGKYCVIKDTMHMRKNHMKYIVHRRSETVRKGMRWGKDKHFKNYSLEKCINCHARDKQGKPVKLKLSGGKQNPQHFCVSCHRYTAVTINCFKCHSGTPTGPVKTVSQ